MKFKVIVYIGILLLISLYLNRTYAHIFSALGEVDIQPTNTQTIYKFGDDTKKIFTYVALGDSLTVGEGTVTYDQSYPFVFAKKITSSEKNVVLIPVAKPGIRSKETLSSLTQEVIQLKPDLVTILIGVNDVYGNISSYKFYKNYESIVTEIKNNTNAEIVLINLPYLGSASLIKFPFNYYFDWRIKTLNNNLKKIADIHQLKLIDIYSTNSLSNPVIEYSLDNFHPTGTVYSLWAQKIYDTYYR